MRVITIPNVIDCLAIEKLASYNICENVTYGAVSLVGHGRSYILVRLEAVRLRHTKK